MVRHSHTPPSFLFVQGGCPHAAIREDISANLDACENLTAKFDGLELILLESGGDNLAANFSPELSDFTIYVIDVAGGDKVRFFSVAKKEKQVTELRSAMLVISCPGSFNCSQQYHCHVQVPRKGGPGVTQSDLLVINKTDLAEAVGASLEVMDRDAKRMRGDGPTIFCQARQGLGLGVDDIVDTILAAWKKATAP